MSKSVNETKKRRKTCDKKRRKTCDTNDLIRIVGVLGDRLEFSLNNLSKNIVTKAMVVQKYETLFEELSKFEGLTENEVMVASSKFTKDVGCMIVFFSVPAHQRISQ
ncbi:hypothetical protein GOBAR_DD25416 [Gossypium barbadense]|nr:hypothetical protein GOBAR_DD25416 [Gossypium barbadense]